MQTQKRMIPGKSFLFHLLVRSGAAVLVLMLSAAGVFAKDTKVILPENYEDSPTRRYPVLYLMPDNGTDAWSEEVLESVTQTLAGEEAMDMIVVCPTLPSPETEPDLYEVIRETVEETDASYRTVADPGARAIGGVYNGAYLAALLGYTDPGQNLLASPDLFGMVGCVSGNFTGDDNPWSVRYGSVREMIRKGPLSNAVAMKYFSFIRSASEDENAYEEDGANDLISYFIQRGAAYGGQYYGFYGNADDTVLDLTIPHDEDSEAFRADAAARMVKGFTRRMLWRLVSGGLSLSTQAVSSPQEEVEAVWSVKLRPFYSMFVPEPEENPEETGIEISLRTAGTKESAGESVTDSFRNGEGTWDNAAAPLTIAERSDAENTEAVLSCTVLGAKTELDAQPLVRIRTAGEAPEDQFVDLMGEWYFQPVSQVTPGEVPEKEEYSTWEKSVPCLGWWDEKTSAAQSMKAYAGYVWYIRDFELPSDYPQNTFYLPLGSFDETDVALVNGVQVGCTGMDEELWVHREDKWDTERVYEVPAELLNFGGENTVQILTHNESGDGGWYTGHPGLYTQPAMEKWFSEEGNDSRFLTVTIPSSYKAQALKTGNETEEESFLVYLPEGYDDPENQDRRYPTAYLFHQLNSTSRSYILDGVDKLLDEGIADGRIKDVIVIIPDSAPESWWMYGWDKMVTEEILPYVDENYRTIADAAHRFTAGASMGGHGAWYIGLTNPDLFSGMISYYGALNMGGLPLQKEKDLGEEEAASFRRFFICGNRDLYEFGVPAIELDHLLRERNIPHFFALDEGGHDSSLYLPYFIESFAYMTE